MRVYKRGRVYWCYVLGKRQTTHCTDYEAACLYARRLEREGADPRHAAANSATLGDSIRELKAELVRRGRASATRTIADQKLGHAARIWGEGCPMSQVTAGEILRYVDRRMGEGASRLTIRDELSYLRQTLTLARRLGRYPYHWDDVNPHFRAEYTPRKRTLTPDEVRAALDELEPHRAAHVAWLVATGCDVSDAVNAKRSDVNLREGLVDVRGTKNRFRLRRVPITPLTRSLIRFALDHAPGDDPLFEPWPWIQGALKRLAVKLKMPHFSPKDLRRTHGTWLRDAGVAPHLIGRVLGHADSTMAERVYARGADEALARAVQRAVQPAYKATGKSVQKRAPVRGSKTAKPA